MAMVQQVMPAKPGFGYGQVSGQPDQGPTALAKLSGIDRVIMIDDNTCCEKIKQAMCPLLTTCFCPRRYRLTNVETGYAEGGHKLYTIQQTKCCCPEEWTLKNPEGEKVHTYSRTHCCYMICGLCCGGPGMDVTEVHNGQKGNKIGSALKEACQCFSKGYDIKDGADNKKYFIGNPCFCCASSKYFTPIWNAEKSEVLKMNVHVTPCLKKKIPCFFFWMKDYWVVDFPIQADGIERSDLIAGTVMSENTFM